MMTTISHAMNGKLTTPGEVIDLRAQAWASRAARRNLARQIYRQGRRRAITPGKPIDVTAPRSALVGKPDLGRFANLRRLPPRHRWTRPRSRAITDDC